MKRPRDLSGRGAVPGAVGRNAGVWSAGQASVQGEPLRLTEPGRAVLPVCVAWKPMVVEPRAGMAALYATLRAVT